MRSNDFLKTEARTPLHELFVVGDAVLEIRTNSASILKAARESFVPEPSPFGRRWREAQDEGPNRFAMRFWVDPRADGRPPWPKPYVRGLNQVVFAGFDSGSSILIDLRSHRAIGRFCSRMAEDRAHWREVIFPMMMSIIGGTLGMAELHCGCVAKNRKGLLLAGPSGSGKSTLSLAMSQAGFDFLSDDRTLCSLQAGTLMAWGMPVLPKLRREAAAWFPELRDQKPRHMQNGELVFRCNPDGDLHFKRIHACQPQSIIFLERKPGSGFQLCPMPRREAAGLLAKNLMKEDSETVEAQAGVLERLVDLPCWHLQYDAAPHVVAERLSVHLDRLEHAQSQTASHVGTGRLIYTNDITRADPVRRFVSTPHAALLPVMGRSIRVESNNAKTLARTGSVFAVYDPPRSAESDFRWRIVTQPGGDASAPWPARSAFSDPGVRFAEFGQTNFMAVDLDAREGVGYIAEGLIENDLELTSPFLDHLFSLTAGSLGLTSIFAACVGTGGNALLIVGEPANGKTSASYLAAKAGLEFHADRAVFLEVRAGRLSAWGDFWPAVFRPEALKYYPELQFSTRMFRYREFTSYYLDKRPYSTSPVRAVTPVCCVFLERRPAKTTILSRIARKELSRRLDGLESFHEDVRFQAQRAEVFNALEALPAYDIEFEDPAYAAKLFPALLRELGQQQPHTPLVDAWQDS